MRDRYVPGSQALAREKPEGAGNQQHVNTERDSVSSHMASRKLRADVVRACDGRSQQRHDGENGGEEQCCG
jgi:hypothetical protein